MTHIYDIRENMNSRLVRIAVTSLALFQSVAFGFSSSNTAVIHPNERFRTLRHAAFDHFDLINGNINTDHEISNKINSSRGAINSDKKIDRETHLFVENNTNGTTSTITNTNNNTDKRRDENNTNNKKKELNRLLAQFQDDLDRLTLVRPNDPSADTSTPAPLISAGSSYTRIWTHDTWAGHGVAPHRKYMKHVWNWNKSTTTRKILPAVCICTGWAACISLSALCLPSIKTFLLANAGSSAALGALTAPLALLLTLRTNASLSRLSEARTAWGRLIFYTRSMASVIRTYLLPKYPEASLLAARHLAVIGWILKGAVRGETRESQREVLELVVNDDENYAWLEDDRQKLTCVVMLRLRSIVATVAAHEATLHNNNNNNAFLVAHQLLEDRIDGVEQVVGICQRLLASPIPPTYSRHLSRALFLWLSILPFGLVGSGLHMLAVTASTAFVSYIIIGIDEIGMEIENPFPLLPLQQLAAAVQQDVASHLLSSDTTTLPTVPLG